MEIRKLSLSDQSAFEAFQALLLAEQAAGNPFIKTKKVTDFPAFVAKLERQESETDHPDWSTSTNYYAFMGHEIAGRIGCRWELQKGDLSSVGGHIGYVTSPQYRRQGVMKELLSFALDRYQERGIDKVLITALEANEASSQTILSCGGVLQDTIDLPDEGLLARYWVATNR